VAGREGGVFDDQAEFRERFEWSEAGIRRLAPEAETVLVVDVLTFTTAVDVAVGRRATVAWAFRRLDTAPARSNRCGRADDLAGRWAA